MTDATETGKLLQGTPAWFAMVGELMCHAASQSGLSPTLHVSFLERYTDGAAISGNLVQGIRFDIVQGKPSFRVGVGRDEKAEIMVEVTASAARHLNSLRSTDPDYQATRDRYVESGQMRVHGDPSRLGTWLESIHDPVVVRTR